MSELLSRFLRLFRVNFSGVKTLWIYAGCVLEADLNAESRWHTEVTEEILSLADCLSTDLSLR